MASGRLRIQSSPKYQRGSRSGFILLSGGTVWFDAGMIGGLAVLPRAFAIYPRQGAKLAPSRRFTSDPCRSRFWCGRSTPGPIRSGTSSVSCRCRTSTACCVRVRQPRQVGGDQGASAKHPSICFLCLPCSTLLTVSPAVPFAAIARRSTAHRGALPGDRSSQWLGRPARITTVDSTGERWAPPVECLGLGPAFEPGWSGAAAVVRTSHLSGLRPGRRQSMVSPESDP